tara:strand:- start:22 stop:618 length:597 start_codon:yes stop_codon:yes gene_type:complete
MSILNIFKDKRKGNIKLFPEINEIFTDKFEENRKVFFPICSIKLKAINKDWGDEYIHLVQFNEDPYNREPVKYFTDYCKDTMFSFDLINGKYKFQTNHGYFDLTEDWIDLYNDTKRTYQEAKDQFKKNGNTFGIDLIKLGGEPGWWQADETPLDPDGNKMEFITEFESDSICDDGCDKKIFLFYSPKHKIAVQLYQIT